MKTIAFCNQKGGVGKTTTAVSVGANLATLRYRTLLVDMDPQGNAGSGLGIIKHKIEKSIYHALIEEVSLNSVIRKTEYENLYIAPANKDLIGAEVELVSVMARETKLRNALATVEDQYDYCLVDCPPSLNLLAINALMAADEVVIPVQTEYYALEGITGLLETIELVRRNLNAGLNVLGVVLTMYDSRNRLANDVVEEVRSHFKDKVFQTIIPRNVRLSESPSYGQPITAYDPKSRGSEAYRGLAEEIHARVTGIAKGGLRLVGGEQG